MAAADSTTGPPDAGGVPPILVPVSNLTRYVRVRLWVADGMVQWEVPWRLLGIIPIGMRQVRIPFAEVTAARIARRVQPLLLLIGLVLIVVPWFFLPWWASLLLLFLGFWVAMVSMGPRLIVATRLGRTRSAPVCFGHQLDADLYLEVVKELTGL
jgi:hypothetical protein